MKKIKIVSCPESLIDYYTTIKKCLKHIYRSSSCEGNVIYNNYRIHGRHINTHTVQIITLDDEEYYMEAGNVSILDCLYSIDQHEKLL